MPVTEHASRLSIRLPANVKERIEQAAMVSGMSVTDFTISNLTESADEVLEQHHFRKLSGRDRDIFLAMLDAGNKPNKKLVAALKARKELIAE
ncbi:MAG TPA: DUF1778 domain-containing protein [Pyrinomonadaceae bacterium]|nr:DUF1778 domain-containing protein [Pyrinomonadaceae bacterium]